MSSKKEARKAKKRARAADEVELEPARAAGTGVRRGPPVAPTSGRLSGTVVNDEWQTLRRSWAQVAELFDAYRSKRVWMPFYYDGACAEHVRSLGFEHVVHRQEDFFERVLDAKFLKKVDLIWDNPPYTSAETKERVLRALAASGVPFAMLLPISVLHVAFVREILDMEQVQVIIPRRVHVCKTGGDEVPFKYLCWLCYKTTLPRDVVFVDDDDADDGVGDVGR